MSFSPYASYKDSGVEWLGEVPSQWRAQTLKTVASWNDEVLSDATPPEEEIDYLEISGVNAVEGITDTTVMSFADAPSRARRKVRAGDVLISTVRTYLRAIAPVTENSSHLIVSTGFAVVRPTGADGRFLGYAARSEAFIAEVISRSVGVSYPAINASDLVRICIALPPRDEQQVIADFLDRETAKIDALVEAQRRLIALLKEKRQAVISHAVTKGLDPSAPLKPSGIDWLGDVPAHWEVKALKRELAFLTSGSRGWADHYADEGALFIRIGNLTRDRIDLDLSDIQRVDVPTGSESERTRVHSGDLLFSITAYLGSVAVAPADLALAFVSQHVALARLTGERLLPKWTAFVTASYVGRTYLEIQGYGGTKIQLALDDIAGLLMTVPPIGEQAAILSWIEAELTQLDELAAHASDSIALLTERRVALISAAVTGKINVRGWTAEQVRNAVGAEIVHLHARDRTFGRVQNQKLLFLAQNYAAVEEIGGRFQRKAAGPHDADLMASIEQALTAEGVIKVSQPGGVGSQVAYTVAARTRPDRSRLRAMLGDWRLAKLDHLLEVLADEDTRGVEAVATLYGVWNDALLDGETLDDERLIRGFMEWHPEKAMKFKADDVRNRIGFMRRNGLVPEGRGSRTQVGALL